MTVRTVRTHHANHVDLIERRRRRLDECRLVGAAADNRLTQMDEVDAQPAQHLAGEALDIEHAEQDVSRSDLRLAVLAREPSCPFECALGAIGERQGFTLGRSHIVAHRFDNLVTGGDEVRPLCLLYTSDAADE